jgi:very-short-patch-repair endonuclease
MDTTRELLVERARKAWLSRLIDTSRRNNLLFFRDLKTGTVDLRGADPAGVARLLAGEEVRAHDLWPDDDVTAVAAKLREIARRALSNEEEKGLKTLYVAIGMATWTPSDDGRPAESPVLLLPLAVKGLKTEGRNLSLVAAGDIQVNLALIHALETEHGCRMDAEALLGEEGCTTVESVMVVVDRLRAATKEVKGFDIRDRRVIGNFSFQKMAMVRDLRECKTALIEHDLVAALAGDGGARDAVIKEQKDVSNEDIERTHPDDEFLVVDADSSQQRVTASVLAGSHGVVQGPPGGGKSQTIVNLISSLAAHGKHILFVAEKRAALQVVMDRMQRVGLGHLFLDLHGADVSQRRVMEKIRETLEVVRSVQAVDGSAVHRKFSDRRARLDDHVRRIHTPSVPSGFTVFEMHSRLLRLNESVRSTTRWRGGDLDRLNGTVVTDIRERLRELESYGDLVLGSTASPWRGANIGDGDAAQTAVGLVASLLGQQLRTYERVLGTLAREMTASEPLSLADGDVMVSAASRVGDVLQTYDVSIFDADLDATQTALLPAGRRWWHQGVAWLTDSRFRAARRAMLALRQTPATASVLLTEAGAVIEARNAWNAVAAAPPRACSSLSDAVATTRGLRSELGDLCRMVQAINACASISDLRALLSALSDDGVTPFRIPRCFELQGQITTLGGGAILREIQATNCEARTWDTLFEHAWLSSCLDSARAKDSQIVGFDGRRHEKVIDEFKESDVMRTRLAVERVKRAHAEYVIAAMNQFPEQAALVRGEAQKKMRHRPLRKLVADAPDVLLALCPCWMASPLSVSQLLPANRRYFDCVLFDEASQVLPEDAVPAILRGSKIVVAGDRHQLPPTTFFADGANDEEVESDAEIGAVEGYESVLDLMSAFLQPWMLEWHYRSRDERLIAFANRHIYGDRLITFPGVGGEEPLSHELVPFERGRDGQEDSVPREVERVIELVLDHARKRPDESLGVITMGIKHAKRIESTLDAALIDADASLQDFFSTEKHERFFIKNLERVQGDERDAIILSIGYGKDRAGNLPYRFGPLLYEGGERRLNVAITRARHRLTLVSSFGAADMDPSRSKARGVELLRLYLDYVSSRGARLGETARATVPLNDFEEDIYRALEAKGVPLEPQWGASRYRIDMVAKHPSKPGRFVLAIECDGASYHSAPTARDRDRLRQQQLEALGWRFHRIWSTDWFQRRESEIARTIEAYERAVEFADRLDSGSSTPQVMHTERRAATKTTPVRSVARPRLPVLRDIGDYGNDQLDNLIRHIESDGLLRSDEDVMAIAQQELHFQRLGPRIRQRLGDAIRRVRSDH